MIIPLIFVVLSMLPSDGGSIKNFDDDFSVALVQATNEFDLQFSDKATRSTQINYEPNTALLSGVQASYKGLTLAYVTPSPFSEESIQDKGKTSYEDIRGGLFLGKKKQWVLLGYYNRYKGFYVNNTAQVDPTRSDTETPFIQNSAMETFNSGLSVMYIFSPDKFSASAAYVQSDQQKKSGGSWLGMISVDSNVIKNVDGFNGVPSSFFSTEFAEDQDFQKGRFLTSSASVGYGYTFVLGNFYITGTYLFGYGAQAREFTVGTEEISGTENTTKQSIGGSFGFNSDNFFFSTTFVQDTITYTTRTIEIEPNQHSWRGLLGIRF